MRKKQDIRVQDQVIDQADLKLWIRPIHVGEVKYQAIVLEHASLKPHIFKSVYDSVAQAAYCISNLRKDLTLVGIQVNFRPLQLPTGHNNFFISLNQSPDQVPYGARYIHEDHDVTWPLTDAVRVKL